MPDTAVEEQCDVLVFYVNGRKVTEPNADPETTLLFYLRENLRLTGSKLGCGEGGCGSCTVMVSKWDAEGERVRHFSVNACLAPAVTMYGCAITTVEGIGSTKTRIHEVQKRMAENHGSQCGFCTPGFVMSMYSLLRNSPNPKSRDIDVCLQGNLCRCTGYRPILAAFNTFTDQPCCGKKERCCMMNGNSGAEACENSNGTVENGDFDTNCVCTESQETIFPPELMISSKFTSPAPLKFVGERVTWYRPADLNELIKLKKRFPDARIITGNTEVGIETNIKGFHYPVMLCPVSIPEMNVLTAEKDGLVIGAACTLSRLEDFLSEICAKSQSETTQPFRCMIEMLELFAGKQIRNVACIGGNIMTASPISDINPILVACGTTLTFASSSGMRDVVMDEGFFTGYRRTSSRKDEILIRLKLPYSTENDVVAFYKQSKRKDDDIAIVNTCMWVKFEEGTDKIAYMSAAFGGMAPVTKTAKATMEKLKGKIWNQELLDCATTCLDTEMSLDFDAPGGMVAYRRALVTSFFLKFFILVQNTLSERGITEAGSGSHGTTGIIENEMELLRCTQTFQEVPENQDPEDTVGRPLMHVSGLKHTTGEAGYLDDLIPIQGELHMALVMSSKAHAKLLRVDPSLALQSPGVVDYVDHTDVLGKNNLFGEQVFADEKVSCVGCVIGAVLADTLKHAVAASRKVIVEYEELPRILTIEEAIENESYFGRMRKIRKGKPEEAFLECDYVMEGEFRVGGQEHFYLETQCCIAIPKNEDGEMEIIASCQHPSELQEMAAECLGVANNKVTTRVKRMGGGFGGKERRFVLISNPAVVAARKLGRPVRCVLSRQDDMRISGGRHPLLARYKIGFNADGRIKALSKDLYCNAGNTLDLSSSVLDRAMTHCENCYSIDNIEIRGYICRTNLPSNTAFRGFGAPQAMLVAEDWISRVADYLSLSAEQVRQTNMYRDGCVTPFGHKLENFHTTRCWEECLQKSDFDKRVVEVEEFNRLNKWRKRGIACVPTKFGISFNAVFLNQAGSLMLIYKDGSVRLSHAGTEMGQGLHTKMIQVASRELGIPSSFIHISETATTAVPNTSATAASVGTDLNGMAVRDACRKLNERLGPIRKMYPELQWSKLIEKAYFSRVSLAATGFFRTPNLDFDWNQETGELRGRMYNYFTHGAAASEVEIDILTGHHKTIRTDIVMDIGNSINPSIDIGQVEGGFAQGYGLMTLEELMYSNTGHLWTVGPGAYKLPCSADLPREFNVHLLRSAPNDKAIYSSKAVGEPPLFLAASVFFAIKNAISSTRKERGIFGPFRVDSPATAERIRMTCEDTLTNMTKQPEDSEEKKSWAIRP